MSCLLTVIYVYVHVVWLLYLAFSFLFLLHFFSCVDTSTTVPAFSQTRTSIMSMKNKLGPKNSKESGSRKVGVVKSNRQLTELKLNIYCSYKLPDKETCFFLFSIC